MTSNTTASGITVLYFDPKAGGILQLQPTPPDFPTTITLTIFGGDGTPRATINIHPETAEKVADELSRLAALIAVPLDEAN